MNSKALFSNACHTWETPRELFNKIDSFFHFDLDVAASKENALCSDYFTAETDALKQDWSGRVCWCNPPYGKTISKFIEKAFLEWQSGGATVCVLVPARTDTKWFHDYCLKGRIIFIKGRLHFSNCKDRAPFPSMIVLFGGGADGDRKFFDLAMSDPNFAYVRTDCK